MPIEVSFDGTEKTFEPLPKGSFDTFINSIVKKTTTAGDDMMNIRLVIAEGPYKGRSVFTNVILREDLIWKLRKLAIAAGLVEAGFKGKMTFSDNYNEFIGRKIGIRLDHNDDASSQYFGREEVKDMFRVKEQTMPSPSAPAPMATVGAGSPPPPPGTPGVRRI